MQDITSVHKINKYGDKGSPCRRPRFATICPLGWPLISTIYCTDDMSFKLAIEVLYTTPMIFMSSTWKPMYMRNPILAIACTKGHSTRSYALLISVLIATNFSLQELLVLSL